jgi:hypothetical protein
LTKIIYLVLIKVLRRTIRARPSGQPEATERQHTTNVVRAAARPDNRRVSQIEEICPLDYFNTPFIRFVNSPPSRRYCTLRFQGRLHPEIAVFEKERSFVTAQRI